MASNQAFADRIARIEAGRQWIPEGVVAPTQEARRKRKIALDRSRQVSFVLSLILITGLALVFTNQQPELAGMMLSGDLQGIMDTLAGSSSG